MSSHPNCDGCARGLPLDAHGNHRGDHPWDIQGCTADRYPPWRPGPEPAPGNPVPEGSS